MLLAAYRTVISTYRGKSVEVRLGAAGYCKVVSRALVLNYVPVAGLVHSNDLHLVGVGVLIGNGLEGKLSIKGGKLSQLYLILVAGISGSLDGELELSGLLEVVEGCFLEVGGYVVSVNVVGAAVVADLEPAVVLIGALSGCVVPAVRG